MATRTYTEYPVLAHGSDDFKPVFFDYKIVHTASEAWVPGWVLQRHASDADTLIEWDGSSTPVAVLLNPFTASTTASVQAVCVMGIFNSKYICVGSATTRPTQDQIKLMEDAKLFISGGQHA
jgi:hypothetical protein